MKKIFIFAVIAVLLDQIIKFLIVWNIPLNTDIVIIDNFFNITNVQNTGAAWSIFSGNRLFLIILGFISLNVIYFLFINNKELKNKEKIIYGLLIGGVLGNLIDRIIYGYVIDYLDFNIFGYNYPIFNLADTFIVVSAILIFILVIKESKNENRIKKRQYKN